MSEAAEILIAGAGPTGLAASLFLARRGIPVRLIDAAEKPTQTSKALGVNPRTLALLADTGVTEAIRAEGQIIKALRIHRRGRPLARIVLDWRGIGAAYPMTILPQARTEALLTEALAAWGVRPERGLGLADLAQDAAGVTARLGDGTEARAAVLLGADGAGSTTRKALELEFPGDAWDETWRLADVELEGPPADEGWLDLRPDGPFVCLPFSGSVFRLIGFGGPLLEALPSGWTAGRALWESRFKVSHRMVRRMNVDRVCLAGDAAHIHSPIGARGMNLGIEDAFVFSACAADFIQGHADRLEDYGRLRRSVDAQVVRAVRALTNIARDTSVPADLTRWGLLPLAARLPFLVNRVLRTGMGLDHPAAVR